MKNTDKVTLVQMAQMASAHVLDERDAFFAEVDALLDADEEKARALVKPRQENE